MCWPTRPARSRCGYRLADFLLGQRPSLHDPLRPSLAFVRSLRPYYAAARLPAAVHVGLIAHRLLPPIRLLASADGYRVSRFSRVKFRYMLGVFDSAVPRRACVGARRCVAFQVAGHRRRYCCGDFGAHQLQGYPACTCPCPTLRVRRYRPTHMARGQDGSLLLLYDSFIHYSTPVYPDASRPEARSTAVRRPLRTDHGHVLQRPMEREATSALDS